VVGPGRCSPELAYIAAVAPTGPYPTITTSNSNRSFAIVSISTPGVGFIEQPNRAAELARELNDFTAAMRTERPDRFGFFATLPMPISRPQSPRPNAPWMSAVPTAWCC
jgi:hypothetical protein